MPVDHKIFDGISDAQWLWYFYNIEKDDNEEFVSKRDFVEYLASFTNPEAVQKIKQARDNSYKDVDFDKTVEKMFGKKVDLSKLNTK